MLATALLGLACVRTQDSTIDEVSLGFAEIVDFQSHQLTTDLISVPEDSSLASVDHGWKREGDIDATETWLELTGRLGRLLVFSADGDLEELELELSLGDTADKQRLPVHVILNGDRLERLHPDAEWSSYPVSVPPELVRRGLNTLDLEPRNGKKREANAGGPQLRLRRLRLRSRSGRPLWPGRPREIRVGDGIELPVASFIDLVVRVPENSRLLARYTFDAGEPAAEPAFAYVELTSESKSRRTLFHKRLYKSVRRLRDLDLELSAWSGQLVRIRAGIAGSKNGVLHWHDLRLSGASPADLQLPLPPIQRQVPQTSGRLGRPDVLVILMDAARADAFSPWGGPYPTPALERLAATGTLFFRAMSAAPWTGQSVPSMLTGLYPDTLRVGPLGSRLPDRVSTLAEIMLANGYRTVLWSQHPVYRNHKSFLRGFQEVHQTASGAYGELPGGQELLDDERSTFAWIHLIPPHAPYRPPEPFTGLYSSGYTGPMSVEPEYLSRFPHAEDPDTLSEADLEYLTNRYLENVGFADSLVARVLAELERYGRYQESLIVLLSDHGEAFLEHGAFLHTRSLHSELLHVPLVIKWPAGQKGFAAGFPSPVSLVDLVPTLVDGLGLAGADVGFQGISLIPGAFDGALDERTLYAVTRGVEDRHKSPRPALMLQSGPWRILHNPLRDSSELYNHPADPGETTDLSLEQPLRTLLLRQGVLLQQHWNRQLLGGLAGEEIVEEIDPETLDQLQALGYLN